MPKKKCNRCGCLMPWNPETNKFECLYCGLTIDPQVVAKRKVGWSDE